MIIASIIKTGLLLTMRSGNLCDETSLDLAILFDSFNFKLDVTNSICLSAATSVSSFYPRVALVQKQPPEVFCKKGVLKAYIFVKKETLTRVFSCEIPVAASHLRWLLHTSSGCFTSPVAASVEKLYYSYYYFFTWIRLKH